MGLNRVFQVTATGDIWEELPGDLKFLGSYGDQAAAIAEADPLVTKAGRTFTLHPWTVNEGQLTLTVSFSKMRLSAA